MHGDLTRVLKKRMTRRKFLSSLGVVLISVIGIPAILKAITEFNAPKKPIRRTRETRTFGSGGYGV